MDLAPLLLGLSGALLPLLMGTALAEQVRPLPTGSLPHGSGVSRADGNDPWGSRGRRRAP